MCRGFSALGLVVNAEASGSGFLLYNQEDAGSFTFRLVARERRKEVCTPDVLADTEPP